jgi:lipopolysaccharide/colanic/teichoic acid biosynthesis glycosyltransferase
MSDEAPKPCACRKMPKLYTAAGEFRLKCRCGVTGAWAVHSLGALRAWNNGEVTIP